MYILTITIQSRLTVMNHKAKKQVVHDEQVSYLHVAPQAHEKVYDENERNKKKQHTHKNVIDGIKEALYRVLMVNKNTLGVKSAKPIRTKRWPNDNANRENML